MSSLSDGYLRDELTVRRCPPRRLSVHTVRAHMRTVAERLDDAQLRRGDLLDGEMAAGKNAAHCVAILIRAGKIA